MSNEQKDQAAQEQAIELVKKFISNAVDFPRTALITMTNCSDGAVLELAATLLRSRLAQGECQHCHGTKRVETELGEIKCPMCKDRAEIIAQAVEAMEELRKDFISACGYAEPCDPHSSKGLYMADQALTALKRLREAGE